MRVDPKTVVWEAVESLFPRLIDEADGTYDQIYGKYFGPSALPSAK